jgi:serine/threonine protein kinase
LLKIADLGFAREINQNRRASYAGSPLIMAPEQLVVRWNEDTEGYDYKIDIWALGEMFYYMLTGMLIFMPEAKLTYDRTLKGRYNMI